MTMTTFFPRRTSEPFVDAPLPALEIESLLIYTQSNQRTPLSAKQKKKIIKVFSHLQGLAKLNEALRNFLKIKHQFTARCGLTNPEFDQLHTLGEERRTLKALRDQGRTDIQLLKKIVINAKKLLPLEYKLKWWEELSEKLCQTEWWEQIYAVCIKKNTSSEALQHLRNAWESQKIYAAYSSTNLLAFYNEHLPALEKAFTEEMLNWYKYPAIQNYLDHILKQLINQRKPMLWSMLTRLQCAEYYKDIKCDDLVAFMCDGIETLASIKLKKRGQIPPRQRGLELKTFTGFMQAIQAFCESHPEEKSLCKSFSELKMRATRTAWNNDQQPLTPVIAYFAEFFPLLLQEANDDIYLAQKILNTDYAKDSGLILNRLKTLKHYMQRTVKEEPATTDKCQLYFLHYKKMLGAIRIQVGILIQQQMDEILTTFFKEAFVDQKKLIPLMKQIERAKEFMRRYFKEIYFSEGDIILALAQHIKNRFTSNLSLHALNSDYLIKLLLAFYPDTSKEETEKWQMFMQKLPNEMKKITWENSLEMLKFLAYYVETPILSDLTIPEALKRHRMIDGQQAQKWSAEGLENFDEALQPTVQYLRQVLLKLIHLSPAITLENFQHNTIFLLLSSIDIKGQQRESLDKLKLELENNICNKLNDIFLLKAYLVEDNRINKNKLTALLKNVQDFFSCQKYRTLLFESIQQSCLSLLKHYCIDIIEKEIKPNIQYIKEIDLLFKRELIVKLQQDSELKNVLKKYYQIFSGNNVTLLPLLRILLNGQDTLLQQYAEKRLLYIKSVLTATSEDYQFFTYSQMIETKKGGCANIKRPLQQALDQILVINEPWNAQLATVVELICPEETVIAYRLKCLKELLIESKKSSTAQPNLLHQFLDTINLQRNIVSSFFNETIHSLLEEAITPHPCSPLFENIVAHFGSKRQLKQLHAHTLSYYLNNQIDFSETWLGQILLENTVKKRVLEQKNEIVKFFFRDFFGRHAIPQLCHQIETIFLPLHSFCFSSTEYPASSKQKEHLKLLACFKPLLGLYLTWGYHPEIIQLCEQYSEISQQINNRSEDFIFSKEDDDISQLKNIIHSLLTTLKLIDQAHIPSSQTNAFLTTMTDPLSALEQLLKTKKPFSSSMLAQLADLISTIPSFKLKKLLIADNEKQFNENPYWLTLINHLYTASTIKKIEELICSKQISPTGSYFYDVLIFANRLTRLKKLLHQNLKEALLKEISILKPNKPITFTTNLFTPDELLNFWSLCLEKLKNIPSKEEPSYYVFLLLKFMHKIGENLLTRARFDSALLAKIHPYFLQVPPLEFLTPKKDTYANSSLFVNKQSCSITSFKEKAQALNLLQRTEAQVRKLIPPNKFSLFVKACLDDRLNEQAADIQFDLQEVIQLFSINKQAIPAFADLLRLSARLNNILKNGNGMKNLLSLIATLIKEAASRSQVDKNHLAFLEDIAIKAEGAFIEKSGSRDKRFSFTK